MENINEGLKITGHIKATVKRADGTEFVHCDEQNTILLDLKEIVAGSLDLNTANAMDSLFSGNTTLDAGEEGEDGIWIEHTDTTKYEMNCSWSSPSSTSRKLTGIFTGVGLTIAAIADIMMGFNWQNGVGDFSKDWAAPSTWPSLTLEAADTLTIEWTISVS